MWVNLSLYPAAAPAAEIQPVAEAGQWTVVEVELAPAPSIPPPLALEPASPPSAVLELEQGPTSALAGVGAAELESPGPSLLVGSPSPPVAIKEGEKKPNLTAFPPKLVAEQLTVMDAELFRKVVSSQCLGSTWGKRNKPGNEHLAPTVQATVDRFRRVVSLVVTTCLADPRLSRIGDFQVFMATELYAQLKLKAVKTEVLCRAAEW
ncbi:ral guanine nucleotide dissociation stimulator-like [Diceros bicornis minor]|uniref:ral guanine nucleotide dissociation stimulator-like n=1 Tax=Diceros bicornis minor TaxID=77932 RepID=UPI0026F1CE88|nr:ral guanine nucleotide dissociation stimulator-like [Diceros bicornis minor]